MDDYKLLHMIAEGPLGPTLLVQDKSSGEKRVVKQVECADYTQAQLAYNQALKLQVLNDHPSISKSLHFFVHWEREAHSVYLCTVTRYQELGNLSSFIERQRAKNKAVDEELLVEWVRQLAEAVGHAHTNQLLHRNVKPTNILFSSPTQLLLGDFTVPVVMANLKEVMVKRGGSLMWLSPEELGGGGAGGGSEKADVWSLGCVFLQLATCSFMDGSHYSVLVQRLHKDPSVLDEAMDEVRKLYSSEVCALLEACLRRSVEQRPPISEVLRSPAFHHTSPSPDSEVHDNTAITAADTSSGIADEELPCELD